MGLLFLHSTILVHLACRSFTWKWRTLLCMQLATEILYWLSLCSTQSQTHFRFTNTKTRTWFHTIWRLIWTQTGRVAVYQFRLINFGYDQVTGQLWYLAKIPRYQITVYPDVVSATYTSTSNSASSFYTSTTTPILSGIGCNRFILIQIKFILY